MSYITHRRLFGLIFGTLTGLAYGLVSQCGNAVIMPGVPLYQPPLGMFGNLALFTIIGALLGLAAAWSDTSIKGVLLSSAVGALLLSIVNLLTGQMTGAQIITRKITALLIIFAPTMAGIALLMFVFRWITDREEATYRERYSGFPTNRLARAGIPLLLVLSFALLGLTSIYNAQARSATTRMHTLIQQAAPAQQSTEALPKPLQPPNVTMFQARGRGAYQLQWDKDETNKYAIPRPAGSDQSTVIAHFDNGYLLVCLFATQGGDPECRDF